MNKFETMRESLRQGVRYVAAPQLFETPRELAAELVALAEINPERRVLEPSAGTGRIVQALEDAGAAPVTCVEINADLARGLERPGRNVLCLDFLTLDPFDAFDRVVMNPPFAKGQDVEHVRHAFELLAPGGRLVSIMSAGPLFREDRQCREFRAWLRDLDGMATKLPADTFKSAGTSVSTCLVIVDKDEE